MYHKLKSIISKKNFLFAYNSHGCILVSCAHVSGNNVTISIQWKHCFTTTFTVDFRKDVESARYRSSVRSCQKLTYKRRALYVVQLKVF